MKQFANEGMTQRGVESQYLTEGYVPGRFKACHKAGMRVFPGVYIDATEIVHWNLLCLALPLLQL